jgi:hypothetical protein
VTRLHVYSEHLDLATCKACGGACCNGGPGAAVPEDFGAPDVGRFRSMVGSALKSRQWVVEKQYPPFVAMDETRIALPADLTALLYLEPAQKRTGSSVFGERRGCTIFGTRPTGCRALKPVMGAEGPACTQSTADAVAFLQGWVRVQDVLRDVVKKVGAS